MRRPLFAGPYGADSLGSFLLQKAAREVKMDEHVLVCLVEREPELALVQIHADVREAEHAIVVVERP